ncbi:MAG: glycosyltransferase family 4 protein [Candidatus Acidiferrum sp.]
MSLNCVLPQNNAVVSVSEQDRPAMKGLAARVVFLKNCVTPHFLPVLRHIAASVESLRVLVSTPMEADRTWKPAWDGIHVTLQKSFMLPHRHVYEQGFAMTSFRHFPYDSLPLLYRSKPDVVISGELGFRTAQAVVFRRLNPASRLVIWADLSEHTEREVGRMLTLLRRVLLRAADAVVVNGSSGAKYVLGLNVPLKQIFQAPLTTEISPFLTIPLAREPRIARRLLYLGRLIECKGLDIFLSALAKWASAHPGETREVWFVGDGPLRQSLERFPLPAQISLKFLGNVPYEDLSRYPAQAGLLVFPTLSDTWGLAVNEALAAGLPVLGSLYSQAVQELVEDGVNGWTYRADHPDELRDALGRALSAPLSRLAQMREAARSSVEHLTPEYFAGRFVLALRVALEQHK